MDTQALSALLGPVKRKLGAPDESSWRPSGVTTTGTPGSDSTRSPQSASERAREKLRRQRALAEEAQLATAEERRQTLPPTETFPCSNVRDDKSCTGSIVQGYRRGETGLVYPYTVPCQVCSAVRVFDPRAAMEECFAFVEGEVRRDFGQKLRTPADEVHEPDPASKGKFIATNRAALAALKDLGRGRRGLILTGEPEAGKTFLALHGLKRVIVELKQWALFLPEYQLDWAFQKAAYPNDQQEYAVRIVSRATNASWLALDDLAMLRNAGPNFVDQLDRLIHVRHAACRGFLVTTNSSLDGLRKTLGPRATSRLLDVCGEPVEVIGQWRSGRTA
jgi:hypothetical protein